MLSIVCPLIKFSNEMFKVITKKNVAFLLRRKSSYQQASKCDIVLGHN